MACGILRTPLVIDYDFLWWFKRCPLNLLSNIYQQCFTVNWNKLHLCTLLQFFILLLYGFSPQPTTINQVLLSSVGKIFRLNCSACQGNEHEEISNKWYSILYCLYIHTKEIITFHTFRTCWWMKWSLHTTYCGKCRITKRGLNVCECMCFALIIKISIFTNAFQLCPVVSYLEWNSHRGIDIFLLFELIQYSITLLSHNYCLLQCTLPYIWLLKMIHWIFERNAVHNNSHKQQAMWDDTANKFLTIYIVYYFRTFLVVMSQSHQYEHLSLKYIQLPKAIYICTWLLPVLCYYLLSAFSDKQHI